MIVSRSPVAVTAIEIGRGLRLALLAKAGLRLHLRGMPLRAVNTGELGLKHCVLETSKAPSKAASRNRIVLWLM